MVDLNRRPESTSSLVMGWFDDFMRYFRNIQKKPIPVQIGVGATGGWISGYFFTKGSKVFAIIVGTSLLLLQFFNYRGYIKFRRNQLQQDLDDISDRIKKELGIRRQGLPNGAELDDFINRNAYLFSGFVAGNLIGYGMA
uniref:FUN14 family protein n=1 Tax=Panagrellus redivivus TaxID=6233 RepID=A0A7E4UMM2_PANRE